MLLFAVAVSLPVAAADDEVIFSAEQTALAGREYGSLLEFSPPFWTPSEGEIRHIKGLLPRFLQSTDNEQASAIAVELARYRFQYLGVSTGRQKLILANGFCDRVWKQSPDWRTNLVFFFDGGRCLFRVRFDIERGTLLHLEIHGEA